MKFRIRIATGAVLVLAASVIMSGVAAAQPEGMAAVAVTQVGVAGPMVAGTDITNCYYYNGAYRACSYFHADPDPEVFTVCDRMDDGLFTKGMIDLGDLTYSFIWLAYPECASTPLNIVEGKRVGIRTGVEGVGWGPYKYGYA